jgi:hypothetical protein
MLSTDNDRETCREYSARDAQGRVHCYECPLRVDTDYSDVACKATFHYDDEEKRWVPDWCGSKGREQ